MVAILEAQARVIWPQERALLARLGLAAGARVIDLGAGTGLITARLAGELGVEALGVDLFEGHIAHARRRFMAPKLSYQVGDARATGLPDKSFDWALARCILHALPDFEEVIHEALRLARDRVYFLAEDYGLIIADPGPDPQSFFLEVARQAASASDTDLLNGRKIPGLLRRKGCRDVRLELLCLDNLSCPAEDLAAMYEAWGAGYIDFVTAGSGRPRGEVAEAFRAMAARARDPNGYIAWYLPAITARPPA